MSKNRIYIRIDADEKNRLQKTAESFGYNLSEYIRYKIFNENADLEDEQPRYISPIKEKHNILSISVIYKILHLSKEILLKQGFNNSEVLKLEQKALEYAREQREVQGYKLITPQEVGNK